MRAIILLTCMLHAAYSAPQFVTFKDGKVGVNFGGYHAEAGLGGLLTGNAAHGGLSASAGTPHGQNAAAGLGGRVDGRTSGFAYAGAEASPSVGASAALGGDVSEGGFAGAESHAHGKTHSTSHTTHAVHHNVADEEDKNAIQKIKPPKKYHLIAEDQHQQTATEQQQQTAAQDATNTKTVADNNSSANGATANDAVTIVAVKRKHQRHHQHRLRKQQRKQLLLVQPQQHEVQTTQQHTSNPDTNVGHSNQIVKSVQHRVHVEPNSEHAGADHSSAVGVRVNSGILENAFNIPIGILQSLQKSLSGFGVEKSVNFQSY